jgi:hypothetical protein
LRISGNRLNYTARERCACLRFKAVLRFCRHNVRNGDENGAWRN